MKVYLHLRYIVLRNVKIFAQPPEKVQVFLQSLDLKVLFWSVCVCARHLYVACRLPAGSAVTYGWVFFLLCFFF